MAMVLIAGRLLLCDDAAEAQVVNFDVPGNFAGQTFSGVNTVNYAGKGALIDPSHNYWNAVKQNGAGQNSSMHNNAMHNNEHTNNAHVNSNAHVHEQSGGQHGNAHAPHADKH